MSITKKLITLLMLCSLIPTTVSASTEKSPNIMDVPFQRGTLRLNIMADNAVRVQYIEGEGRVLPEWVYLPDAEDKKVKHKNKSTGEVTTIKTKTMSICIDNRAQTLSINDIQKLLAPQRWQGVCVSP